MNARILLTTGATVLAALLWSGPFFGDSAGTKISAVSPRTVPEEDQASALAPSDDTNATALDRTRPVPADAARLVTKIRDALASFSVEQLDVALSQSLPSLVEKDPVAAAELAESLLEPTLRAEVIHLVARGWGEKDPRSALRWAGGLKTEYEREAALTEAGARLALTNPAQALAWTAPAFRADEPSPALETLAHRWAEINFQETLQWICEHSRGAQRNGLIARIALVEASHAPGAAARLVAEEMGAGELQDEAAISVLHQWARRDPVSALAWAGRFPSLPLRERAFAELEAIAKFSPASQAR